MGSSGILCEFENPGDTISGKILSWKPGEKKDNAKLLHTRTKGRNKEIITSVIGLANNILFPHVQ